MSWVTLNSDAGADRLTDREATIYRERFLADGEPDPLPEILSNLVSEIRGRVAAYPRNKIDRAPDTIPANLVETARAIARYRLLSRLPAERLVTDARRAEYKDALKLLDDVAAGRFAVDQPTDAGDDLVSLPPPSINSRPRHFRREDQDGI